jgi:hypothetical protein
MKQPRLHTYVLTVAPTKDFDGTDQADARLEVASAYSCFDFFEDDVSVLAVLIPSRERHPVREGIFKLTLVVSINNRVTSNNLGRPFISSDTAVAALADHADVTLGKHGLEYFQIEKDPQEGEEWRAIAVADARSAQQEYLAHLAAAKEAKKVAQGNLSLAEGLGATTRELGEKLSISHQMICKMLDDADERDVFQN